MEQGLSADGFHLTKEIEFSLNKDSSLIKARAQGTHLWIGNVYIPLWSLEEATKLMCKVRTKIPVNEWTNILLLGDFNLDLNKAEENDLKNFRSLCKQMGLIIVPPTDNTRANARLDFAIAGSNITIPRSSNICSQSDHNALVWEIEIKNPKKKTAK